MRIGEEGGECRAAFASRLPSTCTMRSGSAIARGRSGGRSMSTGWRPPPVRNVVRAWSTSAATFEGLGRDGERSRLDAARVEEVRDQAPHAVGLPVDDAEELAHLGPRRIRGRMEHGRRRALDRGERRAQLVAHHLEELRALPLELLERREILHRDDDRGRPLPPSERMGVELTSVRTLRPSGTDSSISSAWVPVLPPSWWTRGSSSNETSRPSARRQVTTSRSCSVGQPVCGSPRRCAAPHG